MADLKPPGASDDAAADDLSAGTAADLEHLSPPQRAAVRRLVAGETVAAAAAAAGVSRRTVFRWLSDDPHFAAAHNGWRADLTATAKARLTAAADGAVTAVVTAMGKGDARTAMALLGKLGLLKPQKVGPTDPADIPIPPDPAEIAEQDAAMLRRLLGE